MSEKLKDRVAIVTGAGQGIGREIALKLAGDGAVILANDLDAAALDETVTLIDQAGGHAVGLAGDVTEDGFAEKLVTKAVDDLGGLHIIVNNAGYIWNSAIHNHGDDQWEAMLDIHAKAPFRILRAAGRYFRGQIKSERDRRLDICRKIVNISSISGVYGAATQISYSAGKMAVVGITKTLAKEWGHLNITVNAVAFGPIETRLIGSFDETPETVEIKGHRVKVGIRADHREAITKASYLGRMGRPDEAAGAVYLMCIPESDYITGQVLVCSGGTNI
jgi:3-oxoacyl-[acyl-carrier protein] reductase